MLAAYLLLGLAVASADLSFDEFLVKYNKRYTHSEYKVRQNIYLSRVEEIKAHNIAGKSYTRVVNQFSDQTEAELSTLLGFNKLEHTRRMLSSPRRLPLAPRRVMDTLPESVDWTTKGATTAVKNQGGCGSCWAFAGTESIESCGFLGSGKLVTLAPQEFVDCVGNPSQCGGSGGCEGATPDLLFDYAKTAGAILEKDYPYQARDAACRADGKAVAVKVGGYVDVENNNYDALMQAVVGQPIAVGVAANEWFSYDKGVFSFDDCGADVDHAVLLVGYGTDATHGDYWKIQNSWGPDWGEKGFIRLARSAQDSTKCQVDSTPLDGFGCKGGPANVTICGTCGVLFGASYPINCSVL